MNNQGKNKESNFVMQGMILASASIFVRLIGLIYRIPLTNILGNDGNAFYSNAFEVYNIALLLSSYSVPLAVSKLVSIRMKKRQTANAYRVFKGALWFTGSIGLVVALSVYFGAEFLATNIMKMPMSTYALKVLAPCLFIVSILGVIRGFFQGLGTTLPTAISQIFEQIVNAIISIAAASYLFHVGRELSDPVTQPLIPSAYGAAGGTLGTVSGALTALVFMMVIFYSYKKILFKQIKREKRKRVEPYSEILSVLMITILPVILSSGISNINTIIDQGIYNNMMALKGYTEAEYANLWGIFSGKYKVLMNVPLGVSGALAAAFIPSITAAAMGRKKLEIRKKINLAVKFSMLIAMPCFVAFLIYANDILFLLFNDDTIVAGNILRIGSIGLVFICLSTITSAVLQGFNRMMVPVNNAAKALIVHITCLSILLYFLDWNIYAVVISDLLFAVTLCVLNVRAMSKIVHYKLHYGEAFILPLLASISMGIVSYAGYLVFGLFIPRKITFIMTICMAIFVYGLSLLKFQIIEEEDLMALPGGHKITELLRRSNFL